MATADDTPTPPHPARSDDPARTTPAPPALPRESGPADRPAPPPPAAATVASPWGLIPTALVALSCGLGGSYVYNRFLVRPGDPNASSVAGRPVITPSSRSGTPARAGGGTNEPSTAPVLNARELSERIDGVKVRLDRLQSRVDDPSRGKAPPEVETLQVRVADLTQATDNVASLPSKLDRLDHRVDDLASALRSVRKELRPAGPSGLDRTPRPASSGDTSRTVADGPSPRTPATTPAPPADRRGAAGGEATLNRGAELFRRGRYQEAKDVFGRLELDTPDDARVWYYAALSDGFVTKDWTGGAARLVEKGMAREEAGTPGPAEIDAAFKDLTSANGKDWLATYRKRVNRRK